MRPGPLSPLSARPTLVAKGFRLTVRISKVESGRFHGKRDMLTGGSWRRLRQGCQYADTGKNNLLEGGQGLRVHHAQRRSEAGVRAHFFVQKPESATGGQSADDFYLEVTKNL